MNALSIGIDSRCRLKYPQPKPTNPSFYPIDVPEPGGYYRVMCRGATVEGYLDRVSRLSNGLVVGFVYTPEGELLDTIPIKRYSTWLKAMVVGWRGKF